MASRARKSLFRVDSMEMAPQGAVVSTRLRDISRQRLLEEMVQQVLYHGQLEPRAVQRKDGETNKYVILVVDTYTLRVITTVCNIHNLLQEGVCLVEQLDNPREALPVLDAIYFISPTEENIRLLLEDTVGVDGKAKRGKYKSAHVFFTHFLPDPLLGRIASAKGAANRIHTFAELNLSFVAHDQRVFHLARQSAFDRLMDGPSAAAAQEGVADQLATLCASLGALEAKIRFYRGPGDEQGACASLAADLEAKLLSISSRGPLFQRETAREGGWTVIIVNRAFDWLALLAHDFCYESIIYDLLGGSAVDVNKVVFKHNDGGIEKTIPLGEEKDALWARRHQPLWEVNEVVVQEVKRWAQKDEEMRGRTASATSSSNMATMAVNAMNALQSLPEHKERFARLQVHSDLCHQCFKQMEEHKLIEVGTFEQEILTGIDSAGRELLPKKIEKELGRFLGDPDVPPRTKFRTLLLYLASGEEGARDQDKRNSFARLLPRDEKEAVLSDIWRRASSAMAESPELQGAPRRAHYRERWSYSGTSPRSTKLRRWAPRVKEVLEKASSGDLSSTQFPFHGSKASGKSRPSEQIILFVIGGMSMAEARQAHQVSGERNIDVFVGSDCIVTPSMLMDNLLQKVRQLQEEEALAAAGGGMAASASERQARSSRGG